MHLENQPRRQPPQPRPHRRATKRVSSRSVDRRARVRLARAPTARRPTIQLTRRDLMSTTNINRVVLTGNLTQDPELRSTPGRHRRLQPAHRVQLPAQGRDERRMDRQAQLLRRHHLRRAGRERRPLPHQRPGRRHRRTPGLARVAEPRRLQAPSRPDHRRHRPVPRHSTTRTQRPAPRPGARHHGQLRRRHSVLIPRGRTAPCRAGSTLRSPSAARDGLGSASAATTAKAEPTALILNRPAVIALRQR